VNKKIVFGILGIVFGFLLTRAGATTPDFYANLFLFKNLQLLWVITAAVSVGAIGMFLLKKAGPRRSLLGEAVSFEGKPMKRNLALGALIFGAGWGLSASCPGTVLAMLGQGRIMALPIIGGVLVGNLLYAYLREGNLIKDVKDFLMNCPDLSAMPRLQPEFVRHSTLRRIYEMP